MPANPFPNVPFAPGVPSVSRALGAATDILSGDTSGLVNLATGEFTGVLNGTLTMSTGALGSVTGALSGVIDQFNRVSAQFNGPQVGGTVLGLLSGTVDPISGLFGGVLSGSIGDLRGQVPAITPDASNGLAAGEFEWGLFDSTTGEAVVIVDSVFAIEYQSEARVSTYPIEQGQFGTFNKVMLPFDLRLTLMKGGSIFEKNAFLQALDDAQQSTSLYEVRTPEKTYLDVNVVLIGQRRTAERGATLLAIDVGCTQIRETAEQTFVQTQSDAGATPVNNGPVQPQTPTPTQAATFAGVQ